MIIRFGYINLTIAILGVHCVRVFMDQLPSSILSQSIYNVFYRISYFDFFSITKLDIFCPPCHVPSVFLENKCCTVTLRKQVHFSCLWGSGNSAKLNCHIVICSSNEDAINLLLLPETFEETTLGNGCLRGRCTLIYAVVVHW